MLSKKEKDFKGLTEAQKIDLKKMFNEYLVDYSKLMDHKEAVIYAMHKCRQNIRIL